MYTSLYTSMYTLLYTFFYPNNFNLHNFKYLFNCMPWQGCIAVLFCHNSRTFNLPARHIFVPNMCLQGRGGPPNSAGNLSAAAGSNRRP